MSTDPSEQPDLFEHAVALHEAGRFSEAIEAYRRVLEVEGEDATVQELLGAALLDMGEARQAIECLDRSLAIDPTSPTAWLHRGSARWAQGDSAAAIEDVRASLAIDPSSAAAAARLATFLLEQGALEEAGDTVSRAILANPDETELRHLHATASIRLGRLGEAESDLDRLLAEHPEDAIALALLTRLRASQGRPREAVEAARRAFAVAGDLPESRLNLATALASTDDGSDAEEAIRLVDEADPDSMPQRDRERILALAETALGRAEQAIDRLRRWTQVDPGDAHALGTLASALRRAGRIPEAVSVARQAAGLAPRDLGIMVELGRSLLEHGDADAAIEAFESARSLGGSTSATALELVQALRRRGLLARAISVAEDAMRVATAEPELGMTLAMLLHDAGRHREAVDLGERTAGVSGIEASLLSNHLFGLHYPDGLDEHWVKESHERLANRGSVTACSKVVADRDESRPLRIGFVSGDLRAHSVAWFLRPLLRHLDRDRLAVFAYSNGRSSDAVTAALRRETHAWREIVGRTDEQVVESIREDRIDVLVDLSGHTGDNRLGVFRRSPAPVAITWLGYPNTTGVREIGWRIVDPLTDPEGADRHATEALLRIGAPFLCFDRDSVAIDVPRRSPGPLTFGSFNNTAKVSNECLSLWSRVLAEVPESRLLLKSRAFEDQAFRRFTSDRFTRFGFEASRLDLRGFSKHMTDHHLAYAEVDIALDTYPYHGTTTTCEALWNGVPVVSRIGHVHRARVGKTILHAVGLTDLACEDDDSFVAAAAALAANGSRRETLRAGLRERMRVGPLCDGEAFARRFEGAIRHAWTCWCRGELPRGAFLSAGDS
ncbi:MAG: tetratricopeptide repeat protein [Phycisphaerales bacterium]